MVDDRAARGKDGSMIHCFHNLDVFGMRDADFTGSPTRWIFED